MTYEEFLDSKKIVVHSMGIEIKDESINNTLFDYQHDIVKWALKKVNQRYLQELG